MTLALICLLVFGSSDYYRIPDKTRAPAITANRLWVFFTDKGISRKTEYQAAVQSLDRTAPAAQLRRRQREPIAGFDFDDLPVKESYVREIEALGGRVHTVSNWLNAASFELVPGIHKTIYALPFVYDMKPVVVRTCRERDFAIPLPRHKGVRARSVDSTEAHRFYGPSYDQARMMGVPELRFRGFTGTGVKLAIFDTGLKLNHLAVDDLRIYKQHDFLSGAHFHCAGAENGWDPQPIDRLRYLGLVNDPALVHTHLTGNNTFLLFVADSFSYQYHAPRRAIFYSTSTNSGNTWTAPVPVVLSQPASQLSAHTFANLCLAGRDSVTYLAYNDLSSTYRGRPNSNVYLGYFIGENWHSQTRVDPGRRPDMVIAGDTLCLGYVSNDSTIVFRKASITTAQPNWVLSTSVNAGEPLDGLEMTATTTGQVVIIATTQQTRRVVQFRSTDAGASFSPAQELVPIGAYDAHLKQQDSHLFLFYKDTEEPPFVHLSLLYSEDFGLNWTSRSPVTDSTLSIGGFAAEPDQSGITLLYETGGLLHRTRSADLGSTWQEPVLLDTAGFCYMPSLAGIDSDILATWVKRGDDNTVWEQSDTAKFSRDQPDHGTRMASLIAGYQEKAMVGVAYGVDLMVAKTELLKVAGGRYYEYDLEEDTYVEALEWAEREGADIVSTSLGYRGWYADDQFDGKTAPVSIAASLAAKRGMILVTAMGNRDTLVHPWPNPYIVAPADAEGIIAAGGVERNLLPWRGTGTGPTSDGRCKPELVALADTVTVVCPDSVNALEGSVGTSCATALIAGCCALLKQAHPNWSADSIKQVLFATATHFPQSCTFGFGVPRVDSAIKLFPPDPDVRPVTRDEIWAFPNPFVTSEHDTAYFAIELTDRASWAKIHIFSLAGTLVDTIRLQAPPLGIPGLYKEIPELAEIGAFWDGKNLADKPVASGLYLVVLETSSGRAVAKFALVR